MVEGRPDTRIPVELWMADLLIDGSPMRVPERAAETRRRPVAPASVVNDYIALRRAPPPAYADRDDAGRGPRWRCRWLCVPRGSSPAVGGARHACCRWPPRRHGAGASAAGTAEVLFSELLLWGWMRRLTRQERELANATRLLDLVNPDAVRAGHATTSALSAASICSSAGSSRGRDVSLRNGHSRRVARHATMVARGMGAVEEE